MSEPHDRIPDELISAFLDGELDAQQLAQVEQLLDSEPRYQQMLEEFRTLRETLRSLPCQRLDAGFQQRVLRMAEQRSTPAIQLTPARKPAAGDGRGSSSRGYFRGLFWAAAAVAAAIILTVFGPPAGRDGIDPVALHDPAPDAPRSTPAPADRESDAMLRGSAPTREEWRDADGSGRADAATEAAGEPTGGAAGYGVRVRASKRGRETLEMVPAPRVPEERFDPVPPESLKQTDAQPEGGLAFDADADPEADSKRAAGAAFGGIAPVEAAPVAGAAIDTSSDELLADAVIHIRLARAEKSPEARLTDNLVRNQIAVVRQEAKVADQQQPSMVPRELPELLHSQDEMGTEGRSRKQRAVYITNQSAVDLDFVPTEGEVEPVILYLVQAPVAQIATAVNQLQQEGGTVLAALPGPQPEPAPLPEDNLAASSRARRSAVSSDMPAAKGVYRRSRGDVAQQLDEHTVDLEAWNELFGEHTKAFDVNRAAAYSDAPTLARSQEGLQAEVGKAADPEPVTANLQAQKSPGLATAGQSVRSMALKETAESTASDGSRGLQEGQPIDDAMPAPDGNGRNWDARTNGRERRLGQLGSWHAGEPFSPLASSPSQAQQRYSYYQYRTLFRDPQQFQKQLVGLTAGRGGERPLQFLIVLHGQDDLPPAAAEAAEAAPTTAEPTADAAPSDPP